MHLIFLISHVCNPLPPSCTVSSYAPLISGLIDLSNMNIYIRTDMKWFWLTFWRRRRRRRSFRGIVISCKQMKCKIHTRKAARSQIDGKSAKPILYQCFSRFHSVQSLVPLTHITAFFDNCEITLNLKCCGASSYMSLSASESNTRLGVFSWSEFNLLENLFGFSNTRNTRARQKIVAPCS